MLKRLVLTASILVLAIAAYVPQSVQAGGHEPPAMRVELTDADFCFGAGGVGVACNSGCGAQDDTDYANPPVPCPGPVASITFEPSSLLTAYCGSQSTLVLVLRDAKGLAVADDTLVSFTTNGGTVTSSGATKAGLATTTFSIHADTTGVARVIASVGSVQAEKEVHIGCYGM